MPLRRLLSPCLLLMSVLLIGLPSWAARTMDLYSEEAILAANARQSDQDDAVSRALEQVLIRATGRSDVDRLDPVAGALRRANDFLSTFRFENSDVTLTNVLGEAVPAKRMIMRFDQEAIEQFLMDNRLPVWGAKRPETLIWLADRLDGADHILADNEQTEFAQALVEAAKARGVPIILPIMDLTDTLNVSFTDIYGLFTADVDAGSERYPADATLVGRIMRQGEGLQSDFIYLLQDDRQRYAVAADTPKALAEQLVDRLARRLADQYAVVLDPAMAGQLTLRVDGVTDLATLATVENYLTSLNLVSRATLRQVRPTSIQFDLEISGDRTQLRDVLALDERWVAVQEAGLGSQLDNELVYRWRVPMVPSLPGDGR